MEHVSKQTSFGKYLVDSIDSKMSIGNDEAKTFANKIALMDGFTNETLTYKQCSDKSYQLASALRKLGANNTSFGVAIMSPNHINFFPVLCGISMAGASAVSMNPLNSPDEAFYQLELADAKILFCHSMMLDKILPVTNKLGITVVLIDKYKIEGFQNFEEFIAKEDANKAKQEILSVSYDIENVAIIPFSSGTTGKSKGVMLTNRNIIANVIQAIPNEAKYLNKSTKTGQPGVAMVPLPFFHIYGMVIGLFVALHEGAKVVFLPQFDLKRFLELIQSEKVTRAYIVPPIVIAMTKHPMVKEYNLSSIECVISAAAPLGADVQEACQKKLGVVVKQGWGMTELSPLGTISNDESSLDIDKMKGNSGELVGGTEGKVVSLADGADILPHEEGEILIRGPQVMKGYLKNTEASKATIRPDGWLHTGDIGYFNKEGYLYITDRSKELIKYKGFQVPPAELEAIILTMPQIQDVVVIPVLDDEAGEVPRAYVVKHPTCPDTFTDKDVIDYVASRVAPHKKLRGGVRFTSAVPKSPSGKLLRRVQIQIDRGEIKA